jgi:hypothetical protein
LGYRVDKEGLHPLSHKIEPILKAPVPNNVAELQSFIGMINYYARFISNHASRLSPLYRLLHQDVKWSWGPQETKAFEDAKEALASFKVLVHYDPSKPLVISCDASPVGVGAVLSHPDNNGDERPIAYASRTLTLAERNYAQIDREALALVFAVTKFHQYIYGRDFLLYTDHKPLLGLLGEGKPIPCNASPRVIRWALKLSGYRYTLLHKAGKQNGNADALSRLPLPVILHSTPVPHECVNLMESLADSPITPEEISRWTERDPGLLKVKQYVLQGWPNHCQDEEVKPYFNRRLEISIQDNCLLWGSRVIVPPQGRRKVLEELHEAHSGVAHTKAYARFYVWWPKLDNDIEDLTRNCVSCQENQRTPPHVSIQP